MPISDFISRFWQDVAGWLFLGNILLTISMLIWVLHLKREPMSAIAWSLAVMLLPFFGSLLFVLFGYQTIHLPIARRRRQRAAYRSYASDNRIRSLTREAQPPESVSEPWRVLAHLAQLHDGFPVFSGNLVEFFHSGEPAYQSMIEAIEAAKHHVHIEFFIFRPDDSGQRFVNALAGAATRGIEVRFLYDSVGSYSLSSQMLKELQAAGGKAAAFLPLLNPVYRLRINLRNHRKILVVDGTIGFTGGLNIGDEYLGKNNKFGPWRDTHLKLIGPAVTSLQQVFLEDWHFASNEIVTGKSYVPSHEEKTKREETGKKESKKLLVQVVQSGPDTDYKAIRETYFAGIVRASKRIWIASPYFVPDPALRDALIFAARSGIDVRYLGLFRPDKWIPFLAARYYWADMLEAGVKVYQYSLGMLHTKLMIVDGEMASIGTANMDNRSLFLNYEVNCLIYDSGAAAELERHFLEDLRGSVQIDPKVFASRPFVSRLAENVARLFSPIL